jgi:alpha-beta hydrolase superfamily lysophospholipase
LDYVEWVEHVARAVAARLAVATHASTFEFTDRDQFRIFVYKWEPTQPAKAAVQIAHGATEHALRYQRVAAFL